MCPVEGDAELSWLGLRLVAAERLERLVVASTLGRAAAIAVVRTGAEAYRVHHRLDDHPPCVCKASDLAEVEEIVGPLIAAMCDAGFAVDDFARRPLSDGRATLRRTLSERR